MVFGTVADPTNTTWVITIELALNKVSEYGEINNNVFNLNMQKYGVPHIKFDIVAEIYEVLKSYGFDQKLHDSGMDECHLIFNNESDVTKAFNAVSLGLAQSWAKYFIERIHLLKIEPNSNVIKLLNKDQIIEAKDRPDWLTDDMVAYLMIPPAPIAKKHRNER